MLEDVDSFKAGQNLPFYVLSQSYCLFCFCFFQLNLDPPIKQGQTRYYYPVLQFSSEEEDIEIELPFTE